jgi:hypothetical protein
VRVQYREYGSPLKISVIKHEEMSDGAYVHVEGRDMARVVTTHTITAVKHSTAQSEHTASIVGTSHNQELKIYPDLVINEDHKTLKRQTHELQQVTSVYSDKASMDFAEESRVRISFDVKVIDQKTVTESMEDGGPLTIHTETHKTGGWLVSKRKEEQQRSLDSIRDNDLQTGAIDMKSRGMATGVFILLIIRMKRSRGQMTKRECFSMWKQSVRS